MNLKPFNSESLEPSSANELRWIQITARLTSLIGLAGLLALMARSLG